MSEAPATPPAKSGNTPASKTPAAKTGRPRLYIVGRGDEPQAVHRLVSYEFRQYPNMVAAVSRDGDPYPILPGRLDVPEVSLLRDVTADLTPAGVVDDTLFRVTYRPPGNNADPMEARVSAADMEARTPTWPGELSINARVPGGALKKIGEAIKAWGQSAHDTGRWRQAYSATGLLLRPGKPAAFLRQGQPALTAGGTDEALAAEMPAGIGELPGVRALALDDPAGDTFAEDLAVMLKFCDAHPDPAVGLALWCQLALAPWSALPGVGRVAVVLAGDTGVGKSALAGLITAAQSRTFAPTKEVAHCATTGVRHAKSSKIGIDRVLYPLNGMVGVVDDFFAGKLSSRDVDIQWQMLSSIGDAAASGSGGVKGTREGVGVRADRFPRCNILANAEDLPDEAERGSEVARYVAFRSDAQMNWDTITELQTDVRALSRAHATMIQRGLADLDAPRRAVQWAREQVAEWNIAGHNRARQGYAQLLAGAHLIAGHMREAWEWDPAPFLDDASAQLREAAAAQAARCGMTNGRQDARDPIRLFCTHLRAMLAADPYWLASAHVSTADGTISYHPPVVPGRSPATFGWRQQGTGEGEFTVGWQAIAKGDPLGFVHVAKDRGAGGRPPWRPVTLVMRASAWPDLVTALARHVQTEVGWSLPSADMLKRKLVDAGVLRSVDAVNGELWDGGPRPRVLKLDLLAILGDDDAGHAQGDDDAGQTPQPPPPPTDPEPDETLFDATPAAPADAVTKLAATLIEAFGEGIEVIGSYETTEVEPPTADPAETAVEPSGPVAAVPVGPAVQPRQRPSGGRRRGARPSRSAVLDTAGLWRPGATEPIPAPAPQSLADAYRLAVAHGVGNLYLMPDVAGVLGLPAEVEGALGEGIAHPWANLAETGLTTEDERTGRITRWMNVWTAGGERNETGRGIALPHLDAEFWAPDGRWPDARTLADGLGAAYSALGTEWYIGAAVMGRQMASRVNSKRATPLVRCEAIATEQVPAVLEYAAPELASLVRSWSRPLTPAEAAMRVLYRFDRNAAYPSVYEGLVLGIGEPEHRAGPIWFDLDDRMPGYFRTAGPVPTHRPDGTEVIPAELAALVRLDDGDGGGVWLTTPEVVLFAELGLLPKLVEAWVWPTRTDRGAYARPLSAVGTRLRRARERLAGHDDAGHRVAARLVKSIGSALSGLLNEQARQDERRDWLWRPDWRHFIRAATAANLLREVIAVGHATGRWPVATHVDAVYYASNESEHEKALPAGMTLSRTGGGNWKPEIWVSVPAIRDHCGERSFNKTVRELTGDDNA